MSDLDNLHEVLTAAAIGYNDGANKGFWRVQLRDGNGQWMEMGRGLMAKVLMPDGTTRSLLGVYIGPSDRPGYGRMLVKEADGSYKTYEVSAHNSHQFEAKLSEEDLKRQGIENTPGDQVGDNVDLEAQKLADMNPKDATAEDIKLATVTPNEEQKKIIDESRAKSPLTQMPAGAEKEMSPEELAKATDNTSKANTPEVDAALAKLWVDGGYNGKANLDEAIDAIKKDKGKSSYITHDDVTGSTKVYALDDIKKGDYFYDTKSNDILQATDDARWNSDKSAVEVPATDATGADRTLEVSNNSAAIDKIAYKEKTAEQKPEEAPTPEELAPVEPAMPDNVENVAITDLKPGDKMWTGAENFYGTVESVGKPEKTAYGRQAKLIYIDGEGKRKIVSYDQNTKFNRVSSPEESATKSETVPEAPATPEVSTPEAPAAPEAEVKPAKVAPEDMSMSQLLDDMRGRFEAADKTKNANPEYYKPVYEILDNKNLTDSEKLSQIADYLRKTSLNNAGRGQGGQAETSRQVYQNLRKAGVYEASKEYEDKLREEANAKAAADRKSQLPDTPKIEDTSRVDDGNPIAPTSTSNEDMYNLDVQEVHDENGNLLPDLNGEPIYHANSIINALMTNNPEAKLDDEGGLVIERSKFTDHDGTEYGLQITVYPTFGGQLMERYTITDSDGNTVEDFFHSDYKDSVKGLYGKKNGVVVFRDQITGKAIPAGKLTREKLSYFGTHKTLENRMTFFRGKGSKDASNSKVRDLNELINFYLEGRDTKINEVSKTAKSANVRGSRLRSFIASFYEAVDQKDTSLMRQRLVQLLGRLPDNDRSREALISALKTNLAERYAGTNKGKELGLLVHNLDKWMATEGVDLRNPTKMPWQSDDGITPVAVGDKVRAYGNENQTMVGVVVRLNKRSGGNGAYKDTVAIKFADGEVVNVFASRNLEILHDDHPDADAPLDNYEPWIRGDDMRAIRLGDEPARPEEYLDFGSSDPADPDAANPNAATPYLGSDGTPGDSEEGSTKAEDLVPGNAWHSEDGTYLGSVVETVEVPAEDGGEPGIAVVYVDTDGVEQVEVVDKGTVRLPK